MFMYIFIVFVYGCWKRRVRAAKSEFTSYEVFICKYVNRG